MIGDKIEKKERSNRRIVPTLSTCFFNIKRKTNRTTMINEKEK
jgi:hypothetical protein